MAKYRRYPGPNMVPLVLDARGRWGVEAQVWARGIARSIAAHTGKALADLRWRISQALKVTVAGQCYRASGTRVRARPTPAPRRRR